MAKKLYGAGTIVKMKNGKWKWRGHFYDETTGQEHRPTKTFATRKEAEEYRELAFKNDHIKKLKRPQMTVERAFTKWQNEVWKVDGNLSSNTQRGYLNIFNKHFLPLIGKDELRKIDVDKIQKYYNKLKFEGLKQKTIRNINQALDALLKFCITKRLLDNNPLDAVLVPKDPMHIRAEEVTFADAITEDEYRHIKSHFNGIYQYALEFIAEAGVRSEEIAIRHEDVDYENLVIHIRRASKREYIDYEKRKTKKVESPDLKSIKAYRTIPITGSLFFILEKQEELRKAKKIDNSPYIFPCSNGTLSDCRNLLRSFHNACNKAGLSKRGVKSLRKLYITRRIREGMDPKTLQHLVGHESIITTLSFYQILSMPEVQKEANRVDKAILNLDMDMDDDFLFNPIYDEYEQDDNNFREEVSTPQIEATFESHFREPLLRTTFSDFVQQNPEMTPLPSMFVGTAERS